MLWSDPAASDQTMRAQSAEAAKAQQARTARASENTTVSRGDFIVDSGANILVRDGGDVRVEDGGSLVAEYPSGRPAAFFGPQVQEGTTIPAGHGLLVQADDDTMGRDVFRARTFNGQRLVRIGETPTEDASGAVDYFSADAVELGLHAHHGELRLQTHHGAPLSLLGGDGSTGGSTIELKTFQDGDINLLSDERLWLYGDTEMDVNCPNGTATVTAGVNVEVTASAQAKFGGLTGTFLGPQGAAGVANVVMNTSTGQITYVTSTERVKTDIRDLTVDPAVVLQLRPRSWLPAAQERQCPEWLHAQHPEGECHAGEVVEPPVDARREVGFVAEELDALGLSDFVEYDAEGLPASIRYDRLTAAVIPLVQAQQAQIDALTARLDALEGKEA